MKKKKKKEENMQIKEANDNNWLKYGDFKNLN